MTEEELGLGPRNASIKVIILKPARLSLQSTARSGTEAESRFQLFWGHFPSLLWGEAFFCFFYIIKGWDVAPHLREGDIVSQVFLAHIALAERRSL